MCYIAGTAPFNKTPAGTALRLCCCWKLWDGLAPIALACVTVLLLAPFGFPFAQPAIPFHDCTCGKCSRLAMHFSSIAGWFNKIRKASNSVCGKLSCAASLPGGLHSVLSSCCFPCSPARIFCWVDCFIDSSSFPLVLLCFCSNAYFSFQQIDTRMSLPVYRNWIQIPGYSFAFTVAPVSCVHIISSCRFASGPVWLDFTVGLGCISLVFIGLFLLLLELPEASTAISLSLVSWSASP